MESLNKQNKKILKKLQKPCMKLSEGEKDIIYQSNAC